MPSAIHSGTVARAFGVRALWCSVGLLGALAPVAGGQSSTVRLDLQPGYIAADFLSPPPGVSSTTGFNLRFAARLTTTLPWLVPVVGGSVTPYGTTGPSTRNHNSPNLFAGNIFPILAPSRTGGWLTAELPLLVYHSYGGGRPDNPRLFGPDLFLQLAAYVHVGEKLLRELGPGWTFLDSYIFWEQNLTPNPEPSTRRVDRFNPVLLFGLSLRIGGNAGTGTK